jgi:GNAT superfamily N-acetyltransferase
MRLAIIPFTGEHLAGAADVLARRHQRDRQREPALPARFEDPTAAQVMIAEALAAPGTSGMVALRDDRVVGYLLGTPTLLPPTSALAPFFRPRSMRVSYAGAAATAGDAYDVSRALYAALAPHWLAAGCFAHYVQVPATDPETLAAWVSLGFGQDMGLAIRETGSLGAAGAGAGVAFRRAGAADLEALLLLARELARYESTAPVCFPYLPATEGDVRTMYQRQLQDPAHVCWLAERAGRVIGMMNFVPPPPHLPAIVTPDRTVNLAEASLLAEERGRGVGTALLRHALAWARDAAYVHCRLTWMTANLLSSRFWLGHGFRPVMYRLSRQVDERVRPS